MGKPELANPSNAEKAVAASTQANAPPARSPKDLEANRRRGMATIQDDDERLLARIGYRQVCYKPLQPRARRVSSHHRPRNCAENSPSGPPYPMQSPFLVCLARCQRHSAAQLWREVRQLPCGHGSLVAAWQCVLRVQVWFSALYWGKAFC
jgi:hypothetical protein